MFLSGIKLKEWTLCTAEKEMEDAHKSRVLGTHLFIVAPVPSSCLLPFIQVSYSNVLPTPLHNARVVFLFLTVSCGLIGIDTEKQGHTKVKTAL